MNADHTMRALYFANNPQLLVNGSFESEYVGWTATGNHYVEDEVPDQVTDGANMPNFNGGDLAANGVLSQTFPTVIGGIYTMAFDVGTRSTVASAQKLGVRVRGSGNNTNLVSDTVTLTVSTTGQKVLVPGLAAPPLNAVRVVAAFPGLSFDNPICLVSPPGDTARFFVCEQGGNWLFVPENRSVQVEGSTNLTNWSLWDISANNGIALPAPTSDAAARFSNLLERVPHPVQVSWNVGRH